MGAKLSNNANSRHAFGVDSDQGNVAAAGINHMNGSRRDGNSRLRTRAVDMASGSNAYNEGTSSLPSDSSPTDFFHGAYSLPSRIYSLVHLSVKCPVCSKKLNRDDMQEHLANCLSKPRLTYNEDKLQSDSGECIICFEELAAGQAIARLPCLCVYHKVCIDQWFDVNRVCPEHPDFKYEDYPENLNAN